MKKQKHILICGRRQVGKTTMVTRLMRELTVPVYGFQTVKAATDPDGTHHICMYPAGLVDGHISPENHIGDCNMHVLSLQPRVFDELGVSLLRAARPGGVIVMDELGFMEAGSETFCGEVLKVLDGDIPVLATVKDTDRGAMFLDRVRQHPNAELYMLTRENYDEVLSELLPKVRSWNC